MIFFLTFLFCLNPLLLFSNKLMINMVVVFVVVLQIRVDIDEHDAV